MGTCSYVLVGTENGMDNTFGSTCHGAGRALSRNASRRKLGYEEVLNDLREKNISIRVASPKLVMEEAPESYKDVIQVINTCKGDYKSIDDLRQGRLICNLVGEAAGISKRVAKLRPIGVVKG